MNINFSPYFIMITYGLGILMMAITYSYQLNLENKENTVY
jgi:hypothetical protein